MINEPFTKQVFGETKIYSEEEVAQLRNKAERYVKYGKTDSERIYGIIKIAVLALYLVIIFTLIAVSGIFTKSPVNVPALAEVLRPFDEDTVDVVRIEKMTVFRDKGKPWFVYKVFAEVHSDAGDRQETLWSIYDPEKAKTESSEDNGHDAVSAAVIWQNLQNDEKKAKITVLSEKQVAKAVDRAWNRIAEDNANPVEEN